MGAKPATAWTGSFFFRQFDDEGDARQMRGESLATATLPGTLRPPGILERNVGFRGDGLVAFLGEESQLVRVDPFAARPVLLTQQQVHRVLELLNPKLSLLKRVRLLADQLVAEGQVLGQRRRLH